MSADLLEERYKQLEVNFKAIVAELKGRPASPRQSAELEALLSSHSTTASTVNEADVERLLQMLRTCGFAANKAGDFEAAQNWSDARPRRLSTPCDLLSLL